MTTTNKIGYRPEYKLIGIIILQAKLTNISPLLIGSGTDEESDKEIMRKPDRKPYLPGSSLAGKIKSLFDNQKTEYKDNNESYCQFWGGDFKKNNSKISNYQSHIIFDDANILGNSTPKTIVRDGVKIDSKTNLAKDEGKFDYEVLEPGHSFNFRAEIRIREGFDINDFKRISDFILTLLKNNFQVGANEKSGLGVMECAEEKAYFFDFQNKDANATELWFDYLNNETENLKDSILDIKHRLAYKKTKHFRLVASFGIKSTLLTATYGIGKNDPDKVQLSRNNKGKNEFILSGASIRGALRHRSLKILNLWDKPNATNIIGNFFGFADEKKDLAIENKPKAKKSKLIIHESVFTDNATINQTRIKIDRFTGGTIEGALLDAKPVIKSDRQSITLTFEVPNYQPHEVELLLYLLKDLWEEDLAIGGEKNIGRGVLKGQRADLYFTDESNEEKIQIKNNGISQNDLKILKKYLP